MNADTLRMAIGGRDALTLWSLVALLPLGVLAGTLWGLRNGLTIEAWLPVVVGVHLFLIAPFLVCRSIMIRATTKAPRPLLGLAMFAFLGGLRTLMLVSAGALMGVELPRGAVIDFVPNGVGTGVAILGVVAVVVDGSRRHRAVVEQLAALDAEFERTRAFDEAELTDIEARSVAQITTMLEEELKKLQPQLEHAPELAAVQLRSLANDVVRPLSHDLSQHQEWIPEAENLTVRPPRWKRFTNVIADLRPANPLVPFLLIELIALPSAISERVGGVGFSAFIMLLIGGIMFVLSWLVARLWPRGHTTLLRLLALIVLYAVIGTFAAWVGMTITQWYVGVHDPRWIAPFFLILTSIGVGFTTAVQERQGNDEDRMAAAIVRNAQLNAQVRARSRRAQRRIAKLLHSNIQAELIASAMVLTSREGDSRETASLHSDASQELNRLIAAIHDRLTHAPEAATPAKERVHDLTSLWSGILDVKVEVDAEVWEVLDQDPAALDAVVDVVAEGLTNAVRHGDGPQINIVMAIDAGFVTVRVTSIGSLVHGAQAGFGSEVLSDAASHWALAAEGDQVHLTTRIPRSLAEI